MSTTIDNKVVEMRFDNKQFEANVQTSLSTIDKLKQSLNLTGAAKGLENVGHAARNVDMSPLGNAVETVGLKFNAMYTIADQALRNITNSVMNTGKRMISALTIDPVKTGFSEYETKVNAVQTILSNTSSKGTKMEDVTKVLNELNTYADKTIYNFAEMTRNIGTFTAAGVGLEDSATAIQGIANLAASSGSSSQQASTAMYQLSQALSTGTVRLMDWNSVTNAGMGGEKFQEALKATAREHGVAVDDMIEKNGSFRESLQEGWLTADILNTTLKKFTVEGAKEYGKSMMESGEWTQAEADALVKYAQEMEDAATKVKTFTQLWDTLKESAQSGWAQTWEILIGDFEEAKETLTKISDVIGNVINKSAEARNELLKGWKDAGGRTHLVDSLFNVLTGIGNIIKPIKEAFREFFPPTTVQQLTSFTEKIKSVTETFANAFNPEFEKGKANADKLKRTFRGLFAVLDIVKQAFSAIFKIIAPGWSGLDNLGGGFLGLTAKIGDSLVKFNEFIKTHDIFNKAANFTVKAIEKVVSKIKQFISAIKGAFNGEGPEWAVAGADFITGFINGMKAKIVEVASVAKEVAVKAVNAIKDFLGIHSPSVLAMTLGGFFILGFIVGMRDKFSSLSPAIKEFTDKLARSFNVAFDVISNNAKWSKVVNVFKGIWNAIKAVAGGIAKVFKDLTKDIDFVDILNGITTTSVAAAIMSLINFIKRPMKDLKSILADGLEETIGGVTSILDSVKDCFKAYQRSLNAEVLLKIGKAILMLVAAIVVLTLVDQDKLGGALGAVGALLIAVVGALNYMSKIQGDLASVAKSIGMLYTISMAVLLLSFALKSVSKLSPEELLTGLTGVAGMMLILVTVIERLGTTKGLDKHAFKAAGKIMALAAAVKLMASVVKSLGGMAPEQLVQGLFGVVGIAAALVALGNAFKMVDTLDTKSTIKGAGQMVIMSGAIIIMSGALRLIAGMSWENLGKGITGLAGVVGAMVGLSFILGKMELKGGSQLIAMAASITILAISLRVLSDMQWDEIGRGMTALAGIVAAMAILSIALGKMNISGGATLLAMAGSIAILSVSLKLLGTMSWESIAKGLVAIAGAFVIIGVAGLLLAPIAPVIALLAVSFQAIGIGLLAAGAGMVLAGLGLTTLAAGFTALAVAGAAGASSIALSIKVIGGAVLDMIPLLVKRLGEGLVEFIKVIGNSAGAIGDAVKQILIAILDTVATLVPETVKNLLKLILATIEGLVAFVPNIVDALFTLLIGILDGIARNMPRLIGSVVDILVSIITGAIEALANADLEINTDGLLKSVLKIAGLMAVLTAIGALVPGAMLGALGLTAFVVELALLLSAIGGLAQIPGLDWIISEGGDLLQTIGTAIGQFVGGIAGGIAQGFTDVLPDVGTNLSDFMTNIQGFVEGAALIKPEMLDGVKTLIGVMLALTGANIIESISSWLTGGSSMSKFGVELVIFGQCIKSYADAVSGIDVAAVEASAAAAKALSDVANNLPNTGGLIALFAGDNSIASFGLRLIPFGIGLKGFADATAGIVPENVVAAASAAKALSDVANNIPNSGGLVALVAGDNSIARFGAELVMFGLGLRGFAAATAGIVPENVTAAANAAKSLAEMANIIPNQGGIVSWFAGDNSIARFGSELVTLGEGLKKFADSVEGITPETVAAASSAAKTLAEMTSYIPNEGGMVSWFTGENSIAKFSKELGDLGKGLKKFSESTAGIAVDSITAAASAAKTLAEMTSYIPNEGGVVSWFTGENSIAKFAGELPKLGKGLKGFSDSIAGINPENITSASNSAKALGEMTAVIPTEGGIKAWFTGETSISKFADKLPSLGKGLKGFSDSVAGISPENVTAAADAAKSLGDMTATIPKNTDKIEDFGDNLIDFGKDLSSYFSKTSGITSESISASTKALDAVKNATDLNASNIKSVSSAIEDIVDAIKKLAKVPKDSTSEFKNAMKDLGTSSGESLLKAFDGLDSDLKKIAKKAMDAFIDGIKDKVSAAKKAAETMSEDAAGAADDTKKWKSAGKAVAEGFADGISANTYLAEAKAKAMAKAAAKAAEDALDINSPSKVFRAIGYSIPEGFAMGIDRMTSLVTDSSTGMAKSAVSSVSGAISRIADIVNSDIDAQPTIRPVLDLTDVRSGVNAMGGLLNTDSSVGVLANVGVIGSMMNRNGQNGGNGDIISAIDKLRKDIGKVGGNTYNVNGVTYDDGSNVSNAVRDLVRAARIEGRT